jgi:hypothetical protein
MNLKYLEFQFNKKKIGEGVPLHTKHREKRKGSEPTNE